MGTENLAIFRYRRRVEFAETDMSGIIHFASYFRYMEEAEHALLRSLGLSVVIDENGSQVSWPRVSARCEFRSPARFEEELDVAVTVSRLGNKSVTYDFSVKHGDRVCAEGQFVTVCCRMNGPAGVAAIPIPDWIAAKLRTVLANEMSS